MERANSGSSEDINELTSGLKTAVQNEVRSEKLKTELITNVSHDIKTPHIYNILCGFA